MAKYIKVYFVSLGVFLIWGISNARVNKPVDFSEKIMKIKSNFCFRFGARGFGFYDWGDGKLKIFNWNLEIQHSIPITIGEGPSEIKPFISNACLVKDNLLLNGFLEKKINVYNLKGEFIKTIFSDFSPKQITYYQDKLYLFNSTFYKTGISPLLAKIVEPLTEKTLKEVNLKEKPFISKDNEASGLGQLLFMFDAAGYLHLLNISTCTILKIDEDGNIIETMKLPYKFRMESTTKKNGDDYDVFISTYDYYIDFAVIKNTIYACFHKTLKEDKKTGDKVEKTYLVKLNKDGSHSRQEFDNDLRILGEHQGILYLFNFYDYHVIPVKLSEWK